MSAVTVSASPGTLATYQIDEDARLGPCMAVLAPKMRQFVLAKIQLGCSNAKAAQLAGYGNNANTWKAHGWKLAHDDRVQAALLEEARKLIRDTSVMAIDVITKIAQDETVDAKDRLKAAVELLNRSGLNAITEHKVTVERTLDNEALVERIKLLADRLGLDPTRLIGHRVTTLPVVDAAFEVVADDLSDLITENTDD